MKTTVSKIEDKLYGIIVKKNDKYFLQSSEKNNHMDYLLDHLNGTKEGDFVRYQLKGDGKFKRIKIVKNFGPFNLNIATSSLILEKYDIPSKFSYQVKLETQELPLIDKSKREDLTNVPLVTIDGDDSKDFDDAIYAQRIYNGWMLIVAIADVAFYVRDLSEIDKEAYKRGNSVYLPNITVPMLPEALSNDLCSLKPKEERACIACFMEIDDNGNIKKYDFKRAVMKSAARLTYREVQEVIDGKSKKNNKEVNSVYQAYQVLRKAREKRGALELESDEVKIKLDKKGNVIKVERYEHFTSHEVVEEFMIAANVSAAMALNSKNLPAMFRIHDKPLEEKLAEIKPLLQTLNMKLPDISSLKPEHLNKVLKLCKEQGYSAGINDLILRLQSQAKYSPINIGHFGLGLKDYVHFTSPIRRYSDLLVHRALIKGYKMPEGGGLADDVTEKTFTDMAEHLNICERKAVNAERDITARFLSAYLEPSIGADFEVKVSGVSTAGIFVRIETLSAEGLVPMRSLPDDNYEVTNTELKGTFSNYTFRMGDAIKARLIEASPITGGLIFKYVDEEEGVDYYEKRNSSAPRRKPRGEDNARKKGEDNAKKRGKAAKKAAIKSKNKAKRTKK